MLPNNNCTDVVLCLQKLIGLKADCTNNNCPPFFIENIEGYDASKLALISNKSSVNASQFAKDIIAMAANEMVADIEMIMLNTYQLQDTFGSLCETKDFVLNYTPNAGSKVTRLIPTNYALLKISRIDILTDFTGDAVLKLNDGKVITSYDITLTAGSIIPVIIDYSTAEKSVSIYFENTSIGLASISTAVSSGCGCSGKKSMSENSLKYTGLVNSADASLNYGFKVCAAVVCSTEKLLCDMITQLPNMFGLALLYKVASKIYTEDIMSNRNNRQTVGNDEDKKDMRQYYADLYRYRMNGTKQAKGIRDSIANYLKNRKDKCVICNSNVSFGWATG